MKAYVSAVVVVFVVLAIYWVSGVDIGRGYLQGEALFVALSLGAVVGGTLLLGKVEGSAIPPSEKDDSHEHKK